MLTTELNRWRLQYSLRSLLVFVLLANLGMAWIFPRWRVARQQRDAVAAIRALGGDVYYDYMWPGPGGVPPGPVWARRLLGDDFFADAVCVNDDVWVQMMFAGGPLWSPRYPGRITDAWLRPIGKLPRLEILRLGYSHVTDVGMSRLEGLTCLRELDLSGTRVTDAGLEHLKGLTQLRKLDLRFAEVTAQGVNKLREALPKCEIQH